MAATEPLVEWCREHRKNLLRWLDAAQTHKFKIGAIEGGGATRDETADHIVSIKRSIAELDTLLEGN
jgi:hypothetical protein